MRKVLIPVAVIALAIAAAALGGRSEHAAAATRQLRQGEPQPRQGRAALDRHRQPGVPAVVRGRRDEGPAVEDQRPRQGQGLRVGGRLRGREAARLREERGRLGLHAVQQGDRAGQEVVRLRHQPDLVHAGAGEGARLQRLVLQRQPVDRRPEGQADLVGALDRRPAQVQARRAARDDELPVHRQEHQAVDRRSPSTTRTTPRSRRSRTARSTGSSSTCRPRSTSPPCRCRTARSSASSRRRETRSASGWSSRRATRSSPASTTRSRT